MKMLGHKSQLLTLSLGLSSFWLLTLVVASSTRAYGQSSALTECTRALYSGDNALAVQLAEKHLSKYPKDVAVRVRSEEHTSELQSHSDLVCRLLLEKKKLEVDVRKGARDD